MAENTTPQTQEQTDNLRLKRNVKEWAKLGQDILALDLRGAQKLFLLVLAHHMNPTTGLCCPGTGTLAEELGTSPRQVRRLRSQLEDLGLIACVGVVGPESKYGKKVWTYALFIPKAKVGQTDPPQPVKGGSQSPTEGVTVTHPRGHTDPITS